MCRRLAAARPAAAQAATARTAAFAATRPAALGTLASARAAVPGGTFAAPTLSTSTFLAALAAIALAPTP